MSVRLSKICKDSFVSISTIIEYLSTLGYHIPHDPNYKLDDEIVQILTERFSNSAALHKKVQSITKERLKKEQLQAGFKDNVNHLNKVIIPLEKLPHFKQVGHINFNSKTNLIENASKIIDDNNWNQLESEELSSSQPNFSSSNISLGNFDLNKLNQDTRPSIKTKEEMRRERDERNMSLSFSEKKPTFVSKESNFKITENQLKIKKRATYDHDNLKEIWEKFTDVQEQILHLRSIPIKIISDKSKIIDDRLYLTVNEKFLSNNFLNEVANVFKITIDEQNIRNGYFFSNANTSQNISSDIKLKLREKAASNYFYFVPNPVIDGSVNLLKKYISIYIAPNPVYFLKRIYPEYYFKHKTLAVKRTGSYLQYSVRITSDKELDNSTFNLLSSEIGLKKDIKHNNTYTYDFRKYIEILSKKENILFSFDQNEFLKNFNSIKIKSEFELNSNRLSFAIDYVVKVENVIYDILKSNNDIYFYNFSSNSEIDELNDIEILLKTKFPSININKSVDGSSIYFYQEYENYNQILKIKQLIDSELSNFVNSNPNKVHYRIFNSPIDKEKYILRINNESKKESQLTALKELRNYDFCIGKIPFGKLLKVNYPELIFDTSGYDFEKNQQLFESHIINSIVPNLTGEIEKVNRLKTSLNNILNGKNLQNPNLKDFIFDAEKAKKIENIDFHINSLSETFKELEYHLLNIKINESQKQAIIKTLLAEDLALIQGPPGTGKSTAIAEIIWQHIRKNPKERILLTSETNLAVDNAIDRIVNSSHNLVKPIRFGDEEKLEMEGQQFSIEVMKRWVQEGIVEVNSEDETDDEESTEQKLILLNWIENIKNRAKIDRDLDTETLNLWVETLSNPSKEIRQIFYNNYIKNCNLIGATCSSIGERNTKNNPTGFFKSYCEIFGNISNKTNRNGGQYTDYNGKLFFSTIIQDESSKATPAELSLPLMYGKKNIIIGDHRQLPPMLDKEEFKLSLDFLFERTENKDEKKKIQKLKSFVINNFNEMEISHFERLFNKIDPSLKGIFNKQYRMHPDINEVIKQFYINDGGLECGLINPIDLGVNDPNLHNSASRYHGIEIDELISKNNHVIWIDTNSPELLDGTSRINYGEVDAIRYVLTKFRNSDSFQQYHSFWNNPEDQQIGIISFYGKQIKLLRNLRNEFKDIPIRVSTVDRFQGMERNIIIVSMVRSNRIASDKNQKADFNLYGELGFTQQNDLGFAQSPNRLNVALSRAKRLLIIVGNSELFKQKEIYNNVYQTIAENPNGRIIKFNTL